MKKLLLRILYYLQVHHIMRCLLRTKTIILTYHGFTDEESHEGIENYDGKHLSIKKFELQLKYLKKHYNILSLNEWLHKRGQSQQIPPNSVIITLDDGYQSNYTLAFPIFKQLGIPATIFLTTDFVENKEYLWTDRVEYAINKSQKNGFDKIAYLAKSKSTFKTMPQEMRDAAVEKLEYELGQKLPEDRNPPEIYKASEWSELLEMRTSKLISLGSHTHTHVILSRCRPETVKKELSLSKEIIEKRTQSHCQQFCYPNGETGDFNNGTKSLLKECGYSCGLTTVEGFNDQSSDPFELKRLGVSNNGDQIEFIMTVSGVKKSISAAKRLLMRSVEKRT